MRGGSSSPVRISIIQTVNATEAQEYFILVYDCGGDSTVKSYILEQKESLIRSGFSRIIGLRDLYPLPANGYTRLFTALNSVVEPRAHIAFVVAAMETEAWFIAEATHFQRLHNTLTPNNILTTLGVDLSTINVEAIPHPSELLHNIYKLAGFSYLSGKNKKSEVRVRRTCRNLDFGDIYLRLPAKLPSLKSLIDEIDNCF